MSSKKEKTIKVEEELKNKALQTVKAHSHGHLKGLVTTFLRAYNKDPAAMVYMANAIISEAPWKNGNTASSSSPVVSSLDPVVEELDGFSQMQENMQNF